MWHNLERISLQIKVSPNWYLFSPKQELNRIIVGRKIGEEPRKLLQRFQVLESGQIAKNLDNSLPPQIIFPFLDAQVNLGHGWSLIS